MSFHRTIIRLSALLAVVALAKGCGDGESPSAPPMPEPARPTTVTVSPATTELTVLGATVQLSAEVRDQNATVMAGATVTWTTSANSVATVDASGLVRAVGNGTATITASAGSASGSAAVTVAVGVASAPDLVVGSPSVSNSSPDAGASFTLSATVRNQGDGSSAATTLRYYRSINNRITTGDTEVDTDAVSALAASGTSAESIGLTAPSSPGTYYYGVCVDAVTGESDTSNNCSSAVTVTVGVPPPEPARPTTVTVSPATTELTVLGATVQLSAEVRDQNARVMAGATVTWTSSASSVATVDAAGLVTAVGNGTATITASAGSASGSAAVTVAVGVPPAPDLVVGSPSVSNSSPVTGASFTLSATVRNQGSGPSAATTLRYYRSTDATITTGDTEVDTDAVGTLAASGTSDESIDLTAPSSPGTYYYGACVDDVTGESDTSNNCSSAVTVTIRAPDLVVESPSVSDNSPIAGASFTLSATVRNQGDGSSAATTLRYYRSTDATISGTDTQVDTDAVSALAASGTSDESIDLTAPSSAGTYYYGACVDDVTGESDTSNNCSSAVTIAVGVPPAPDLVVGSPSVSNSSPVTGESFTLSATVRNQGSGPSAATTLRYYRSTDATISTGDTQVGTDAVGSLAASGTSDESIGLTAPASVGTYYYGACVDAVTGESDTSNNCSDAVTVTVGAPPPDLVVGSPSVSNSSPVTGASFTLSATVRNQGSGPSAATTLRYYRSTDATISGTDTQVDTDAVSALSASGTSDESIDLTAPSSAGTYYYGACVDDVTGESDTSNNCSSAVTIAVGVPPAPDLVVGSPSVSNSSPVTGASFTLSATVRNQGSGPSAATTLRYYRSTDATISTGDTQVGTDAVGSLAASGTSDESIGLTAPASVGTYYYGACVDAVTGESDTSNNCSDVVTVTVGAPPPDLVVGSPSVSNSSPVTGASFTLSATVRNQGSGPSAATTLRYYRSTDATISGTDTQVGTDAVGSLAASGTSDESIGLTAPASVGTYYYGACVDAVTGESDTSNNCSSAVTVTIRAPDLVVESPSVSDNSPIAGASFTLSATVRNQGDGSSAATTLRYYRSTDATISGTDTQVDTDAVSALSASGTSAESIDLTAPASAGTYYYGACVDAVTGESDTSNNCSSAVTIAVGVPPAPDLVVGSPSVSNSSPVTGASFTLSATVRNQGSGPSAATTLRYYRSTDATISGTDTQVVTDAVGALAASGTSDESIGLTAPASVGTYYYGACVDAVTGESDTSNNCSDAVTVTVGAPPPDLVLGSPSVSNSSPVTGASFTLSATVRNQGSGPSAATTLRYYRSTDATISGTDTQVGTDAVGALAVGATSAESIDLTAPASPGTYYYGACVDDVTGESDTSNNCSSAVTVTVGAPPPDLVVGSPSVSNSSPVTGASFTLSATVRNQGSGPSAATTLRYYRSTDATISGTDTQVDTDVVSALSASATSDESIDLTAPASVGTYYYGACVDSVTGESDTSNNCSEAVTVTVGAPPPDLVVGSPSVSNSSPVTGASFTLSATVRNQGSGPSAATTLRYYRSTDATISGTDTEVDTDAVGTLAASATSAESIGLTAPASAGRYYYGACVAPVTGESDTSNNCSSSVQVDVTEPPPPSTPDLVVASPSVSNSSPVTGASFTLSATVRNQGSGPSAATTLRYYRSTDATISGTDTQVDTDVVSALSASATSDESIDLTAPASVGTYYYGACVDDVTGESDTSNNCSDAVTVTVGAPPDLVVESPSVSDSNPDAGASFTLSATVRNQGSGPSAATTLRYYRSINNRISTGDTEVGTDAVGALSASGTSAESIALTAPASGGTYYYGACVDDVTGESDTSDNCSSAVTVWVVAPDMFVGSPSVSNSSPDVGEEFTLYTTVGNRGYAPSAATTLRYYRSTDATITTGDTQVGTDAVGALAQSATSAESISLTAPASAGRYYYGACVDAVTDESDTSNNCSGAVTVTVGGSDLVAESPSVDDDSPEPGGSFTLSATVRNQGSGPSAATTLRYSRAATLFGTRTEVGTDAVDALAASATSDESIDLTAPASVGTYYYGACVDAVTGESDTSNNCSSSVQVDVTEPPPPSTPDLVVGSPSVSNSSPVTGEEFTLSATVRNQGSGPSHGTNLYFYRSTDATITTGDTRAGVAVVFPLAASATSDESTIVTAPASVGTYYYGACVQSVRGESDTSNNCSDEVTVTVVAPPAPDLVVESPSVSNSSPLTGASFTLSATVRNQGSGPSAATTLRYYRSTDATITTGDTEVGTDAVSALAASGTSDESIGLTAPASVGTYYYGACVQSVRGESDTSNNCSDEVTVTVRARPPDLVVRSTWVSDSSPLTGASFTLSATVRNQGSGPSAATTLRYYRSTDATISGTDTQVGTDAVRALAASGTSAEWIDLTAPASPGTYYYGACVDDVTGESDTSNNCSDEVTVTVSGRPDLVVESPSVDDDSPVTGEEFTLSATVRNQGSGPSAATTLRYYRSTDATITTGDRQVGTDAVGALSASGTSDESMGLTAPASIGTYYYGACVDNVTSESNTSNNCSSAVTVTVTVVPPAPDLVVGSPSVDDDSPVTGASFTLSATVRNQGDDSSAATTLRYYRSTDATISTSDTEVGTDAVGSLAASGTSDESIGLTAPASGGRYYYGACVDDVTGERDSGNNCSSAVVVTATVVGRAPDLIVEIPSVSPSSPLTGASFTLSATVRNWGDGPAHATTLRYYLSTDFLEDPTEVGTDAVVLLFPGAWSNKSIDLTAPENADTYYYQACVDPVTGESDITNNCSHRVEVTVGQP